MYLYNLQFRFLLVDVGVQLSVRKKLNMVADGGQRNLSVVTDGATGKRSAVLNFYPYRTRISSHNLPLATVCGAYAHI